MPEASIFVSGEAGEVAVVPDELLDEKLGPFDPDDEVTVRDLVRDHANVWITTYDVYSVFSMLAAVWGLQQIAAGEGDAVEIATEVLAQVAISGDFEEHIDWEAVYDNEGSYSLEPVTKTEHGGYAWSSEWPTDEPRSQGGEG